MRHPRGAPHPCVTIAVPGSLTLSADFKTENEHRLEICEAGRWLHQKEYVAAATSNTSKARPGSG